MAKVWKDEAGLFVKVGGYIARPVPKPGYAHAYDMTDGGLVGGETVKGRHIGGSPLVKITLADGGVRYWQTMGSYL